MFAILMLLCGLVLQQDSIEKPQETARKVQPDALLPIESQPLDAEPGQYVLCPSLTMLEKAAEEGLDQSTIIFYTATVLKAGPRESEVKSLAGTTYSLPNTWIIPIKPGCKAKTGDVVLSWWQSGSGMQRSIVVGGTETEPEVMYLDLDYDNPAGVGKKVDKLKPDSFVNLTQEGQIGSTAAAKVGNSFKFGRIIAKDKESTALLGFAGRVSVVPNNSVIALPIQADFKAGDSVWLHAYGNMREGKVKKTEAKIGRIFVEYPFGSSTAVEALSFGEVIGDLNSK